MLLEKWQGGLFSDSFPSLKSEEGFLGSNFWFGLVRVFLEHIAL